MSEVKDKPEPKAESPNPVEKPSGEAHGVRAALGDDTPPKAAHVDGKTIVESPRDHHITDARGEKHAVSKDAWDKPGNFAVSRDDQGRTTRIEGWLSPTNEKRGREDMKLQRDVVAGGARQDFQGGHLIAHSLGGPGVEGHGQDLASANLLPMSERINKSYVGTYEEACRRHIDANPGKQFYMQADVRHIDGVAAGAIVTHRLFERDQKTGQIMKSAALETTTAVHSEPSGTLAGAVRAHSGDRGVDFFTPTNKGCAPGTH